MLKRPREHPEDEENHKKQKIDTLEITNGVNFLAAQEVVEQLYTAEYAALFESTENMTTVVLSCKHIPAFEQQALTRGLMRALRDRKNPTAVNVTVSKDHPEKIADGLYTLLNDAKCEEMYGHPQAAFINVTEAVDSSDESATAVTDIELKNDDKLSEVMTECYRQYFKKELIKNDGISTIILSCNDVRYWESVQLIFGLIDALQQKISKVKEEKKHRLMDALQQEINKTRKEKTPLSIFLEAEQKIMSEAREEKTGINIIVSATLPEDDQESFYRTVREAESTFESGATITKEPRTEPKSLKDSCITSLKGDRFFVDSSSLRLREELEQELKKSLARETSEINYRYNFGHPTY